MERAKKAGASRKNWGPYLFVAPGALWMVVFVLIPLLGIFYFSFWTPTFTGMERVYTLDNWKEFFVNSIYRDSLLRSIKLTVAVVVLCILIGYPVAYYLTMMVEKQVNRLTLLFLCIIPFWTSLIIRALAWVPMLGIYGVVNQVLLTLHVARQPVQWLLFSEFGIVLTMTHLYVVFIVGPITFSLSRIDPYLIDAAKDLGATPLTILRRIIFPLSLPGLAAGTMFIFIMAMGDFATYGIVGGFKYSSLPLLIVTKVGSISWPAAATAGVALTVVTMAGIYGLMKLVDLRNI